MTFTLAQIVEFLGSDIITYNKSSPDLSKTIKGIASLEHATHDDISFLASSHYQSQLSSTKAGIVLITEEMKQFCPEETLAIIVKSPYVCYAKLTKLFVFKPVVHENIHPTASIGKNVSLGENVVIGAYCVIADNVSIAKNTKLDSHVTIEPEAIIGESCLISSHVFIAHHCVIGNNVSLHSHASIGNDGFGYAPIGKPDEQGWQKIHQLGRVVIGNNVHIGSKTCVDRGALDDTVIEDNVIIDNLVQIAHNVRIGAGTAIAACVGIAGSTTIGKRCMIGGATGFAGHISVCDDVTFTGMTMVTKSINAPGMYSSGIPVMPNNMWKKAVVIFRQLAKNK